MNGKKMKYDLYDDVTTRIENLFIEMGSPEEFEPGEDQTDTTTGQMIKDYWIDDGTVSIHIIESANADLFAVYREYLGGIMPKYFWTNEFRGFRDAAEEMIDEFHREEAYGLFCDMD